jgi:hypothetical protein
MMMMINFNLRFTSSIISYSPMAATELIQQYPALLLLIPPPSFLDEAEQGMFD